MTKSKREGGMGFRDDENELQGQIEQHEKVVFKADKKLIGSFVQVKITSLSGNTYRGEVVN